MTTKKKSAASPEEPPKAAEKKSVSKAGAKKPAAKKTEGKTGARKTKPAAAKAEKTAPAVSEAVEKSVSESKQGVESMGPSRKILYVTSEAVPFCKTGGLADVAGSLPQALAAAGNQVAVILPLYQKVKDAFGDKLEYVKYIYVRLAWRSLYCGLFRLEKDGVIWYFVDNEQYFKRPELYGYYDDGERFAYFSRAVVELLPHLDFWPDVVHCNDWQSALVPVYLRDDGSRDEDLQRIRTVITVHNIEYQGRYGRETLGDLFGLNAGWLRDGTLEMDGDINLLKGAMLCADAITAVSPSYAQELKFAYFAHGLESIVNNCSHKLYGVLNGIDMERYNPAEDPSIAAPYSAEDLSGKARDKAELQHLLGLREDPQTPVIGMVSRLVSHKGLDLVQQAFRGIMELPVQVVVLGKGDYKYEEFFRWAQQQYPGRVCAYIGYNEGMSLNVYAGADLFLMPSRSEPCGLSQMIAMRYGAVPIVRETGGLKDTVQPYEAWRDSGNGFTFANYDSGDMLSVISQAVELYHGDQEAFRRLQKRGMTGDFSWHKSAQEYCRIYDRLIG